MNIIGRVLWMLALTVAAGIGARTAVAGPSRTAGGACSHYTWPDYSVDCLTSEDGRGATITVRRISTDNSSPDAEVTVVVARQTSTEPLPVEGNTVAALPELAAPAGEQGFLVGDSVVSPTPQDQLEQPVAARADDRVQVVIWGDGTPAAYVVRQAEGD